MSEFAQPVAAAMASDADGNVDMDIDGDEDAEGVHKVEESGVGRGMEAATRCAVCGGCENEEEVLLCDERDCSNEVHMHCLQVHSGSS
jgi:hypothetical protein